MISIIAFVLIAVALDYYGYPVLALLFVGSGMIGSALAFVGALLNREGYEANALAAGVKPSYPMLIFAKVVSLGLLGWLAWHIASSAGYL
jgi:hypothetical protein